MPRLEAPVVGENKGFEKHGEFEVTWAQDVSGTSEGCWL